MFCGLLRLEETEEASCKGTTLGTIQLKPSSIYHLCTSLKLLFYGVVLDPVGTSPAYLSTMWEQYFRRSPIWGSRPETCVLKPVNEILGPQALGRSMRCP